MSPNYNLEKIKFATDAPTFERAVALYESGKVTKFKAEMGGFSATVLGSSPYKVSVSARHYDEGACDCYLGQKDVLCKHMVAVALRAVMGGKPIPTEDKEPFGEVAYSGRIGVLDKAELVAVKKSITDAMKYIKPYNGPSSIWFVYQNSLSEGCRRLSAIVSNLPASVQTAGLLVELLLRLDRKLCNGVDDSDGTVGGFIMEVVSLLQEYVKLVPTCAKGFSKLAGKETCFDWEAPLVRIVDEDRTEL